MKNKYKQLMHRKRASRLLGDLTFWSWESSTVTDGTRTCTAIGKVMGVQRNLDQSAVNTAVQQRLNWVVVCRALCEVNGEVWVESEIRSVRDLKLNDIGEHYEAMRDGVIASVNTRSIVDIGWLCQSFTKTDKVDTNLDLLYLGEVTQQRREAWRQHEESTV